ncbi:anthranilate phosphoribosyltransferase [Corynebacterium terpenotabidum Y-11]|uniref:Anthranilate phosphoribosyltransferase n=2 Tax=Corynebacterium terpenotabidum TaxID=89154 RepID=S4XDC4_9CORY|nr:anthranilate phosphoribosyltransferase [Corynebacterium terpenotabidum]AGP30551.1 anthranilate phosphoribosyltransferase [Corynebacterium terpenotabidum Y-11]
MTTPSHSPDHVPALGRDKLPSSYFTWPGVLDRIGRHEELSESQVAWAIGQIMSGNATESQIAAFSFGIRVKGITAAELSSAANAMREFATPVDFSDIPVAVDIVGTGGDGHHTVNISTMASFVVAAAGVTVVKHGNRAASSLCGGADVLEKLGLDIERDPETIHADALKTNFAFMFAKTYHPAMRYAGPVRSQLGVPTIWNLLGPMTNPATPPYALVGCAFRDMMPIMGGAFAHQGVRALIVRGLDGMDEISVSAPTEVVTVDGNGITGEFTINPRSYGLDIYEEDALRGGDPAFNADIARKLMSGELEGAVKDAVLINAAAALTAVRGWEGSDLRSALTEQVAVAREVLESGKAKEAMERIIAR